VQLSERYKQAIADVRSSLAADRLAHAYVLEASIREEGIAFVVDVAGMLLCSEEQRPCGACSACRHVLARSHPDVGWIEPQKISRQISIDQIRQAEQKIFHTSLTGDWKVCVIIDADRLGLEAANAFLKTLEEPPGQCLFLLVTGQPQALLATVRSRCQRIYLSAETDALPEPWHAALMEIMVVAPSGGVLERMARATRIVALLKEIKQVVADEVDEQASADRHDVPTDVLKARVEVRYRGVRTALLRTLMNFERDVMLAVCDSDTSLFHHPQHEAAIRRLAESTTVPRVLNGIRSIERIEQLLERNLPENVVFPQAMV